ncbi:MAG: NFACT family protein [Nanopusillaceae archaeon]
MITYIDLLKWFIENQEKINNSIVRDVFSIKNGLVLEIYKKDLEKRYLYIIPGKIIFLSDKKLEKIKNKFSDKLKKDLINKKIQISLEDDKILIIGSENIKIYCELIPNGLIVVTDMENKILYATKYKDFGYRKIKSNEKYLKPPKNFIVAIEISKFKEKLEKTNKKDIVRFLAIDLGLSGKYAEYILENLNIEKSKSPKDLSDIEIVNIFNLYKNLFEKKEVLYENQWYSDVNSLFEKIYFDEEIENKKKIIEKKKEEIKKILEDQKQKLSDFEEEIKNLMDIANLIKENYWIFQDYNIENIEKVLKSKNLDFLVEKKDGKIFIKIKNINS